MNNWFLLGIVSLLSIWAGVCYAQVQSSAYRTMLKTLLSHTVPEMSIEQAKALDPEQVYFLDAREAKEFQVSHLLGARPVGYDHFSMQSVEDIPRNARIVVYCSVGYRSEKVSEKLISAGYQQVSNLYGGIFEWVNQGNPLYNENGPTQQVHAYSRTWGMWLKKGEKVY
ncbi:MAG: rhodanese-like domain-containing protein [Saprospiraceae bacterium]